MLQSVDFFSLEEPIHIFTNIFRSDQTLFGQHTSSKNAESSLSERQTGEHVTCVLVVTLRGGRERHTKSAEGDHFE